MHRSIGDKFARPFPAWLDRRPRRIPADDNGDLLAFAIRSDGTLNTTPEWQAADPAKMPAHDNRNIFTLDSTGKPVEFKWTGTGLMNDTGRAAELDPTTGSPQAENISTRASYPLRMTWSRRDVSNSEMNSAPSVP